MECRTGSPVGATLVVARATLVVARATLVVARTTLVVARAVCGHLDAGRDKPVPYGLRSEPVGGPAWILLFCVAPSAYGLGEFA